MLWAACLDMLSTLTAAGMCRGGARSHTPLALLLCWHPSACVTECWPCICICSVQTGKEVRKIADRDRKAAEKAAAAKAAALRDDDNVFDVSYENQASRLGLCMSGRSGRCFADACAAGQAGSCMPDQGPC